MIDTLHYSIYKKGQTKALYQRFDAIQYDILWVVTTEEESLLATLSQVNQPLPWEKMAG